MSIKIGMRIKERRKALGLSADEVARKIGKTRSTIYRYESGDIDNLPIELLDPLSEALQTTPEYLMGWKAERSETVNEIGASADILSRMASDVQFLNLLFCLNKLNSKQIKAVKDILDAAAVICAADSRHADV